MNSARSQQWLIWGLCLSLAVNVFLIGFASARSFRGKPPGFSDNKELARHSNDPEMRTAFRKHFGPLRVQRKGVDDARQHVQEALRAEPFSPDHLATALTLLRAQTAEAQTVLHRELMALASELTPEQRQRLAESRWGLGGRP